MLRSKSTTPLIRPLTRASEEGETMTQTKIVKAHPAVMDFLRHVAQQPAYRDATASCGEAEAYYELNLDVVDELVEYLKSLG